MPHQYVPRMINLEQSDYNIVRRLAEERGLGDKGFPDCAIVQRFSKVSSHFVQAN